MVYATTRNPDKPYPPQKALKDDRGPEGGLFLPNPMPRYEPAQLRALGERPFTARIAWMLNALCDTELTQWDVDFCVNRHPVRVVSLPQKILLAQCWHNQEGSLFHMAEALCARLREDGKPIPTDWGQIALRIAILFAIFVDEGFPQGKDVDVSVISGEFYDPISAWYAREFGLPIGKIVLCCNENSGIWELFHRGQLRTDGVSVKTATPEADVALPLGLERLIFASGGVQEVERFLEAVRSGRPYCPEETVLENLRKGFHVSVVGKYRMEAAMRSVYACGTLLGPYDGLCHAGLLDQRATTGHNGPGLILSARAPELDSQAVSAAFEAMLKHATEETR